MPFHLSIKRVPLDSPIPHRLTSAMDAEIELMYPDAADFPYAGRGNWLTGTMPVPSPDKDPDTQVEKEPEPFDKEDTETHVLVAFVQRTEPEATHATACSVSDEAIGCVGVRLIPDSAAQEGLAARSPRQRTRGSSPPVVTAEIKRMYVEPAYRGKLHDLDIQRSVGAELLLSVEKVARDTLKARRLVLETGMRQMPAMKLYQKNGWKPRPTYGDYIGAGEEVGGLSRCFEKWVV